jgi:hypothetical protein
MPRCRAFATQDILAMRDRLEMRRIDAGGVAAEMVERQPFRDRADEQAIGSTVRTFELAVKPEGAVPVLRVDSALPQPARLSLLDLQPEPLQGRKSNAVTPKRYVRKHIATLPKPLRVPVTKPLADRLPLTARH